MDIFVRFLNATLMITIPLGLGAYLTRRWNTGWRSFGVGAGIFILSQVFHLPFNRWVLQPWLETLGWRTPATALLPVVVFYSLSAGLFEEVARYLGYRFWLRDGVDWRSALLYGAGHGGVEAILLGILALFSLIQLASLRDADLRIMVKPEHLSLARAQVEAYWATPWYQVLLGAFERVVAICFHLSASVLVLQVFRRQNHLWLGAAVLWHTALNAGAVFTAQLWGPVAAEALLGGLTAISLGIIFGLREKEQYPNPESGLGLPPLPELQPVPPSEEQIKDSRYVE